MSETDKKELEQVVKELLLDGHTTQDILYTAIQMSVKLGGTK